MILNYFCLDLKNTCNLKFIGNCVWQMIQDILKDITLIINLTIILIMQEFLKFQELFILIGMFIVVGIAGEI